MAVREEQATRWGVAARRWRRRSGSTRTRSPASCAPKQASTPQASTANPPPRATVVSAAVALRARRARRTRGAARTRGAPTASPSRAATRTASPSSARTARRCCCTRARRRSVGVPRGQLYHGGLQLTRGSAGTRVWDAALLTSRYFERCAAAAAGHEGADALPVSARWGLLSAEWWASRRVLEYGAGTGLVGLALSHLPHGCAPAAVCLTDLRVVLSNLRANAAANAPRSDSSDGSGAAGGAATEVTVAELSWGSARDERAVHEALQPNMALGSDLACPVSVIPLLVKSLESFFAFAAANGTRDPCAIFAVNSKRECTPTFLSLCEERWAVERLPTSELHPKFTSEFTSVLRLTPTGS